MMTGRAQWLPLLVVAMVAAPVIALGVTVGGDLLPRLPRGLAMGTWAVLGLALGGALWKILDATFLKAVRRLAVEVAAATHGTRQEPIDPSRYAILPVLPQAMLELASKLQEARSEVDAVVKAKTAELEQGRARLGAILNELHEGVVVCNTHHQVVLYNQAILGLLGLSGEIGLGRPLFALVAKEPVLHAFALLCRHPDRSGHVPFIAGTSDGRLLLEGRMSLVRTESGEVTGYAVTLSDWTEAGIAVTKRDALLDELIAGLDNAVAALGSGRTLAGEAWLSLSSILATARRGKAELPGGWWPMGEVLSSDLFDFLLIRLSDLGLAVTVAPGPVRLHGDSHALVLAIEALVRAMVDATGARHFDLGAGLGEDMAWLLVSCQGPALSAGQLAAWQQTRLGCGLGDHTVGDILVHHGASFSVADDGGLRLSLRAGRDKAAPDLPSRPEFFDFDLLAQVPTKEMAARPLRDLDFVVFDTETTGLFPTKGDRIVSLAGVRIVNGRVLTGEVFDRVVNPGRPIPPESVAFHGLTDAMVADKPPIGVVLGQFKAYAADAVLVAHNAAFDLKFVRMHEAEAGVAFDNAVLDTMLLSTYVDGSAEHQSLDDIAARYGVAVAGRHTAKGDALITAALLLRLIDALEAKGIRTLGEALDGLDMTMQLHNRMLAQK